MLNEKILQSLKIKNLNDYYIILNFNYTYKILSFNNEIKKVEDIERNFYNIGNQEQKNVIDYNDSKDKLMNNNFNNRKKSYYKKRTELYLEEIQKMITNSKFNYQINLTFNYIYRKEIRKKCEYNNYYYELYICCFCSSKKISQDVSYRFKKINYMFIKKTIAELEEKISANVDNNNELISTKKIVFDKYAFSQLINKTMNIIWQNRNSINNKILIFSRPRDKKYPNFALFDEFGNEMENIDVLSSNDYFKIKGSKNYYFDYIKKSNNVRETMKSGFVITKMYFLQDNNDSMKKKQTIKALCSGFYLENNKTKYVFSNKIIKIDILLFLNNIRLVSNDKLFCNNVLCPDVLVDYSTT